MNKELSDELVNLYKTVKNETEFRLGVEHALRVHLTSISRENMIVGIKMAAASIEMNAEEIADFTPYGRLVHPEDLPIDYKYGMKLRKCDY